MAKKRQQDFARVQLKPGRLLGRRSNITATKFKSRKIIMPKERPVKMKSEVTIEDCIRKIKSCGSEKDKAEGLNTLNKVIQRQSNSLNTHLPQIFETVLDYLRDPYDGVRHAAVKTVTTVLNIADDLQLHIYSDLLCNTISAIMKNPNQRISPVSLVLLDCMLKKHPELICHNVSLLYDLLPSERKHYTRKITNERETYQYSEKGEINALGHINAFIKNLLLLKKKNDLAENDDDEKIVHMDETKTMTLVLYEGSGPKPVDIEKVYAKQFNSETDPFEEDEKVSPILHGLMNSIPRLYYEIIGSESHSDDNAFRCDPIADLSILIQLMCNVEELAEEINFNHGDKYSYSDVVSQITGFLKEGVFSLHRKRFPFDLHTVFPGTSQQPLALLNTSLCFLYMKFITSSGSYDYGEELIENYLRSFFSYEKTHSAEIKYQCVPLFIKMINLFRYKTEVPEAINIILKHLVLLLKSRLSQSSKKVVINFLVDMSLLPEYRFWVDSKPMELWYDWLTNHLKEKLDRLDKNTMKIIRKIAKLRHPSFVKNLDFNTLRPLLKQTRNDDVKETAIFMLHHMEIDHELLRSIYSVVCLDSFTKRSTLTLIRMLNVRFNQYPVNERPYVDYIEFLLNIAIDAHNLISDEWNDLEANEYTRAVQCIQNDHPFCIVPSLHWKEHSEVFRVCMIYLRHLPALPVGVMFMKLVKEVLHNKETVPMHCALAIMKLNMPDIKDKHHYLLMLDLNFSFLMTLSVLTQMPYDSEWYKWNVSEAMESIPLTENVALKTLDLLLQGHYDNGDPDGIAVYHMLRVMKVFIDRNLINDEEYPDVFQLVLQVLRTLVEVRCSDKTMKHQPLYVSLYNYSLEHY